MAAYDFPCEGHFEVEAHEGGGPGVSGLGGVGEELWVAVDDVEVEVGEDLQEGFVGDGDDVIPEIPVAAGQEAHVGAQGDEVAAGDEYAPDFDEEAFHVVFSA